MPEREVASRAEIIAAYKGTQVGGGAEGVGRAVNESVVSCLVAIAIVTVVYTQLFQAFFPEANVLLAPDRRDPVSGVPDYNAVVEVVKLA